MPWLGFFHRWAKSDLYIVLDDVQFLRRGWHHRDKIKTTNGPAWLTLPVKKKGRYEQLIKDVELDTEHDWRRKHLATIEAAYKKAPNFDRYFRTLKSIYDKEHRLMAELNMEILLFMASELAVKTKVAYSSEYGVPGTSTEKLLNLVKKAGGTTYLSGAGAKDYLDEALFNKNGVEVEWQKFGHPVYKQLHGEFVPMMSALDYVMMMGSSFEFIGQ